MTDRQTSPNRWFGGRLLASGSIHEDPQHTRLEPHFQMIPKIRASNNVGYDTLLCLARLAVEKSQPLLPFAHNLLFHMHLAHRIGSKIRHCAVHTFTTSPPPPRESHCTKQKIQPKAMIRSTEGIFFRRKIRSLLPRLIYTRGNSKEKRNTYISSSIYSHLDTPITIRSCASAQQGVPRRNADKYNTKTRTAVQFLHTPYFLPEINRSRVISYH